MVEELDSVEEVEVHEYGEKEDGSSQAVAVIV